MNPRETRGFFNCNPGNLDRSADRWQGAIYDPNDARLTPFQRNELTTGRFCVFVGPEWGIRALAKNLTSYFDGLHLHTIDGIFNRYAPPNENNTAAYKAAISQRLGVGLTDEIDVRKWPVMFALIDGIIRVECAGMPYSGSEIEDGLRLAGVVKPVGVTTSRTAMAGTVATGATVGTTALGALQDPLQQAADQLSPFAGTSHWIDRIILGLKIGLAVIAVIGIGVMVYERVKRERRDQKIDPNPTMVGQ